MQSTSSDPSRTGATWVAGTGAFLLLAAAAVFVAVRWDSIPDGAKLAAIVALTGACLHVGYRYREQLPATAGTLFHLGALLLPIDVAAVGRHVELDWGGLLVAEGLLCLPGFLILSRANDSVVLRWAAVAAGLALSGGIGATTAIPAPLALAALAVTADLLRRDRLAVPWAAVAGLCPAVAAAESFVLAGRGTFDRLGLTGQHPRLSAAVTAVLAASVLGRAAVRRTTMGLGLATLGTLVVGASTTFLGIEGTGRFTVTGAAALFLVLELVAAAVSDDRFWARPTALAATAAEALAGVSMPVIGMIVVAAGVLDFTDPPLAAALLLMAGGWAMAGHRRGGWWPATTAASASVVAGVAVATNDGLAVAAVMLSVAALHTAVRRPGSTGTMAVLAAFAPLATTHNPTAGAVAGVTGALLIAYNATRAEGEQAAALSVGSISPLGAGLAVALGAWPAGPVLAGGAVVTWMLAALLDRVEPIDGTRRTGDLARVAGLVVLAGATAVPVREALLVSAVVAALALLDAIRLDDPRIATGGSVAVVLALSVLGPTLDVDPSLYGVVLTTVAAVAISAAVVVSDKWRLPFLVSGGALVLHGLALASADPGDFGTALLVAGAVAVSGGLTMRRRELLVLGGSVMTVGIWLHLATAEVRASEPYLAPVAILLLAAGVSERRGGANSWQAYGLPVALVGGSALAERLAGGGAGHAIVAGVVGVVAVAVGGERRLQAPLLLGTALLVVLTVYESVALTAGVPTWAWLVLAGSALLAAGVWMDRHEVGPVETGRRLVDVVHDRFA